MSLEQGAELRWYEKTGFVVLMLLVFFPVGLVLLWRSRAFPQRGKINLSIIMAAIVAMAVFVALGSDGQAPPPAATQSTAPNSPAPEESLTPAGGLGDTSEIIAAKHGQPTKIYTPLNKDGYGKDYHYVNFVVSTYVENRAQSIDFGPGSGGRWTVAQAQEEIKKYIPHDSVLVKQWDKDETTRIYYYRSNALAKYFSDSWYEDSQGKVDRGSFTVFLMHDAKGVYGVLIATGNMV
ncbi:MAG: hypothetical protein IMW94_01530 [Thermoanaerobacter sp.]|nr:hypothetical protein [Thermoanaerobacter sp.]